ncbi:MAG: hypothetical protein HY235_14305 [Acidobacteria bacterium]|nr:hypothetical protein [Acidobacteriota bacterium]
MGDRKRSDGLAWLREDLAADGTHPSQSGRQKVARLLVEHLKKDPTSRPWFTQKLVGRAFSPQARFQRAWPPHKN